MFILKIESEGNTFFREWNELQIISQQSTNYVEECNSLKDSYMESGVVSIEDYQDDPRANDRDQVRALFEHALQNLMPYTILHGTKQSGDSSSFYLHGLDRCYVMNEAGKTIQCIRADESYCEKYYANTSLVPEGKEAVYKQIKSGQ